jgi:hypothetical protein
VNWYILKFVYQIISGAGNHLPQFDEQLRLIRADELGWAREKASIVGRLLEHELVNAKNEKVVWKFVNVVEVLPVTSMEDGDEIYSSTCEPNNVSDYLSALSIKASVSSPST